MSLVHDDILLKKPQEFVLSLFDSKSHCLLHKDNFSPEHILTFLGIIHLKETRV